MSDPKADLGERARLLAKAVSRWDNEGGVGEGGRARPALDVSLTDALPLTNAELVQLQVRVIALENILKVLLADASEHQVDLMVEMARFISPRAGFTQHPLTIHAAAGMVNLIESAGHLREFQIVCTSVANSTT
jgi:predicted LPLAT superfamily acyltransferase